MRTTITDSIKGVGLALFAALLMHGGGVRAESPHSFGSDNQSVSTPSVARQRVRNGGFALAPIEKGVECNDFLESYREFLRDRDYLSDEAVIRAIEEVLNGDAPCEQKVFEIEAILGAFWATEPWCKKDREKFISLYTPELRSTIPSGAQDMIESLIAHGLMPCSQTLSAAVTIVKLYHPKFSLYRGDEVSILVERGSPAAVASQAEKSIVGAAKRRSLERKLKGSSRQLNSCRSSVRKLKSKIRSR